MKIVWSELAKMRFKETLLFYKENFGKSYAEKVRLAIFKKTKSLLLNSKIG